MIMRAQTTWNEGVNAFDSGVSGDITVARRAHASADVRVREGMPSEGANDACERLTEARIPSAGWGAATPEFALAASAAAKQPACSLLMSSKSFSAATRYVGTAVGSVSGLALSFMHGCLSLPGGC